MKHPPKPFAVEIKRSRRSPMPVPSHSDFLGRSRNEPDESASTAVSAKRSDSSKPDYIAKSLPDHEFAVPAFLRSEKPASRMTTESLSKEAEQVFGPKPTQQLADRQASESRAQPRILPSLILPESFASEADSIRAEDVKRPAQGKRAQHNRKRKNAASAAQTQARGGRVKENAAATRGGAEAAAISALAGSIERKPRTATQSNAAKNAAPPITGIATIDSIAVAAPDFDSSRTRVRSATRRGARDDIATLPPGQHWKRRLNPRAW